MSTTSNGELVNVTFTGQSQPRILTVADSDQFLAATNLTNAWASGVRQTFSPSATTAGFNPGSLAGDPSGLANADIWYNSSTNQLKARVNGSTIVISGGAAVGTVTSVSFTGGIVSVATATTTPAFTVAGTSGGIPYFSSASTWASSALLASGSLVIGGGAGAAPLTDAGILADAATDSIGLTSSTFRFTISGASRGGAFVGVNSSGGAANDIGYYFNVSNAVTGELLPLYATASATTGVHGLISNTNNADATAYARWDISAGGASGGDAYTLYTISGVTNVSTGIDNSDSDAYVIAASSTLGTTNMMRVDLTGNASFPGTLTLGKAAGTTGAINLTGTTSGVVTVTTAAAAGTWTLTLPTSGGTNLFVLQTNGSGVTSWVAQSGGGGTPGGSTTQLQYNNAGAFGGISTLTTDGTIVTFAPTVTTGSGATAGVVMTANSLTTGRAFDISSSSITSGILTYIATNSTAAAGGSQTLLYVTASGSNGTSGQTTYAAQFFNAHGGTTSTNVALLLSANGGTTDNIALTISQGNIDATNTVYHRLGSGVSTGTGTTAGASVIANSLTTGNGLECSSSSVTTGNVVKFSSTSTAANSSAQTVLAIATSGANSNSTQTTFGCSISNTHTGTGSSNVALTLAASGGATANRAMNITAGDVDATLTTFFRIGSGVTTGTGTTAGASVIANSLTTGNAVEISSSSMTTGNLLALISTSTTAGSSTLTGLNVAISGANGTTAQTVTGGKISVTNTNATSGTNVALSLTASGATTANYALLCTGGVGVGTSTPTNGTFEVQNGSSAKYALWLEGGGASGSASARLKTTSNSSNIVFEFQDSSAGQARIAAFNFLLTAGTTVGSFNYFFGTGAYDIRTRSGNNPSLTISSTGAIQFNNGYGTGTITSDASGNLTSVSDARLKDLVRPYTRGLEDLRKMERPWYYRNKPESKLDTAGEYVNFTAQGAMKGIPEAASLMKTDDGYFFSFNDRPIVWAMYNAILEMAERIEVLEGKG